MVDDQIVSRGIKDSRVIAAMRTVPRHEFVSSSDLRYTYGDYPVPIGEGQTISQPYMVALMTEVLGLKGDEEVLEVGTGSGYQAAVLATIAKKVYSIERISSLAKRAKDILERFNYSNVRIIVGDGTLGLNAKASFDAIMVTAASPSVIGNLSDQLKEDGRMAIPVGGKLNQVLTLVKKINGKIQLREICSCVFVPLIGKYGWH